MGAHLLEVRRQMYSGPKGVSVRVRYHQGSSPLSAIWYSWQGTEYPAFEKGQWLLAYGHVGPGRYGDPIVLFVDNFEWWQRDPILEFL